METAGSPTTRRAALALAGGGALAAAVAGVPAAQAASPGVRQRLAALERRHSVRLGVHARNTVTGATVSYRAGELFPMCSVFKVLAAAAVVRDLGAEGGRRIHYTEKYVTDSGHAPVTGKPANIARGMTVEELCAAAVSESDNGAANLLLRELGGPGAVTRFCRSAGDRHTRLDRWEPELNSAEPWRRTDTTTPRAIGTTFQHLLLGDVLPRDGRRRLTRWMAGNTTNGERFGAGLPDDWTLADKTGGGEQYGVANDVGVVRPPQGPPLVLSVLSTQHDPEGPTDNPLVARAARLAADAVL